MSVVKWVVVATLAVTVAAVIAGQAGLLRGRAPAGLGVRDGRLRPPSETPNSVSSQASLYPAHPMHGAADIAPLPVTGSGEATLTAIGQVVQGMKGAQIARSEPGYLHVQFTTPVMKFVDDAEFWFDPALRVIQVRSASRLGRRDFGVNRRRIEEIRQRLAGR